MRSVRVLVAGDHEAVRDGLRLMLARFVRCTSRSFLVWLIRRPPTSIASCSALYRNDVGTTCGCPSGPTVAIRPRRCPARYSSSLSVNTLMPG